MFITFEGGEGSGKTTQSKLLVKYLNNHGTPAVWTREPGEPSLEVCNRIRDILLHGGNMNLHVEKHLFMADRMHHVEKFIRPALEEGKIVVCDRYLDSN